MDANRPQDSRLDEDRKLIVSTLPDPTGHPAWDDIEALLAKATTGGVEPYDSAVDVVWIAYDHVIWGAATTRLKADETEAELLCVAGKRFREWIGPMEAEMCAWARLCGAKRMTSRGRRGWGRFARHMGWDASETQTFTKEL